MSRSRGGRRGGFPHRLGTDSWSRDFLSQGAHAFLSYLRLWLLLSRVRGLLCFSSMVTGWEGRVESQLLRRWREWRYGFVARTLRPYTELMSLSLSILS